MAFKFYGMDLMALRTTSSLLPLFKHCLDTILGVFTGLVATKKICSHFPLTELPFPNLGSFVSVFVSTNGT